MLWLYHCFCIWRKNVINNMGVPPQCFIFLISKFHQIIQQNSIKMKDFFVPHQSKTSQDRSHKKKKYFNSLSVIDCLEPVMYSDGAVVCMTRDNSLSSNWSGLLKCRETHLDLPPLFSWVTNRWVCCCSQKSLRLSLPSYNLEKV